MWALIAAEVDPVSPWLQLIVQAGALGVLVVLAWKVPGVLAALKEWRTEAERAHREERAQIREDSKEALKSVLEHCDETARRRDAALASIQGEVENLQEQFEHQRREGRGQQRPDYFRPGT